MGHHFGAKCQNLKKDFTCQAKLAQIKSKENKWVTCCLRKQLKNYKAFDGYIAKARLHYLGACRFQLGQLLETFLEVNPKVR